TMVYKGGLQVYTTLSRPAQLIATTALQEGLRQLDKRQGYRGPLRRVRPDDKPGAHVGTIVAGSLREGDILEGTVTKVGRDGVVVTVQGVWGKIAGDELAWAERAARVTEMSNVKSPTAILK